MEKRQMGRGPVEVLGKVLLAQCIHRLGQLACQLKREYIHELLLFSGIWLVLFAGDMSTPSMFFVAFWTLLSRTSRFRSMVIGPLFRLCSKVVVLLWRWSRRSS